MTNFQSAGAVSLRRPNMVITRPADILAPHGAAPPTATYYNITHIFKFIWLLMVSDAFRCLGAIL